MRGCPMRQLEPCSCSYAIVCDPIVMRKWQTVMVYHPHAPKARYELTQRLLQKQKQLKNSCPSLSHSWLFLTAYALGRQLQQHCTRHWTQDHRSDTDCRISIAEGFCFIHIISVTWFKVQLHIHISVHKWNGSSDLWPEAAIALEDNMVCNYILRAVFFMPPWSSRTFSTLWQNNSQSTTISMVANTLPSVA